MLVGLSNVTKSFGAQRVLDGVSFQVHKGRRVGLVGANGSGKTTLLRMIAGAETPDSGAVEIARGVTIGYLAQEPALDGRQTVREAALSAFAELRGVEARLREVEQAMAEAGDERGGDLARVHGDLLERFERGGGYEHESRAEAALHGLGFGEEALDRAVGDLSGGERTRVALARLLLRDVALLLLDEPTNHLDLAGVEWLEQFLARYRGGVLVVSHDRQFLDRVATSIVEIERGRAEAYPGNYTRFREIKQARRLEWRRRYEQQQEFIAREESFVRRYGAGQRAREARGRQTRLERLERIAPPPAEARVAMRFRCEQPSGEVVVRCRGLTLGLGGRTLARDVRFEVARGERLGIVGPNGCGKTTLLRAVLGQVAPVSGAVELGHKVRIGYYDQLLAGLHADRTVLDEVWEERRTLNEVDVRDLLALFRLTGDDVLKRVGDCSGGERSRVALARLIVQAPNLLVLDEPTHHLDIPSREALEQALLEYEGTIVVVSHDRYFLNRIVSKLLVFEPEGVRLVHGNYAFYEQARPPEARAEPAPRDEPRRKKSAGLSKNRFARLEARIIELEEAQGEIERRLQLPDVYSDGEQVRSLMLRRREIESELDELNAQWEQAAEAM